MENSINWEGWNVSLIGEHMKDEKSFIKETGRFWNDDKVAKSLWDHLNPIANGNSVEFNTGLSKS